MSGVLSYGNPTNPIIEAAKSNFPGAGIRGYSLSTTPIEILHPDEDTVFSRGTGFFYLDEDGERYLITCWHVISGRDFFSRQPLSKTGFEPVKFAYYGLQMRVDKTGQIILEQKRIVIEIGEAIRDLLRQGPPVLAGVPADLFAIRTSSDWSFTIDDANKTGVGDGKTSRFINQNNASYLSSNAGDDCFVLGYPLQNYVGFRPPIWKRATLASDTGIPVDDRPLFLIDGLTHSSFSGAPVLRMEKVFIETSAGSLNFEEIATAKIVGIYAGRLISKDYADSTIGYAWYTGLIPELLHQAKRMKDFKYSDMSQVDYAWQSWTSDKHRSGDDALLSAFTNTREGSWMLTAPLRLAGPNGSHVAVDPATVAKPGDGDLFGHDLFTLLEEAKARELARHAEFKRLIDKTQT